LQASLAGCPLKLKGFAPGACPQDAGAPNKISNKISPCENLIQYEVLEAAMIFPACPTVASRR
jgi:hypothetical protein